MRAIDLMTALGSVKDRYITTAEDFRQGVGRKPVSTKRIWLIAAVIVLSVLLVGCGIMYVLSLQDMAFGNEVQEYYDGSSQEVTLLSIQGIEGSPGYQATKEWYEWLQTYDTDQSVYHSEEAFSEDFGDAYYAYNLYSREMKDKLDEICSKHGLELLGKIYVDPDLDAGCKALQIPGIFRPGVQADADFDNICYYANGSFDVEGYMQLSGDTQHIVSFRCHRKNAFSNLYDSVGPEGTYEEWVYTTSYGVDVLMVLEYGGVRGHATMYAEQGEYIFLFSISEFEDMPLPDRAGLEAYAEVFDFTVQPQRVTEEELQKTEDRREEADAAFAENYDKMARSFSELGYDDRIKFNLESAVNPELLSFAVLDLDGNGTEDLLVGENGYIRAVYTTADGGSLHMMPLSIVYMNSVNFGTDRNIGEGAPGQWSYIYLCENNCLAYVYDLEGDGVAYHFASVKDGKMVWTDRIWYGPLNDASTDSTYWKHDETHNSHPITEEEFCRIRDSYKRVPLKMYPVVDYPLKDNSPSGIGRPPTTYANYDELVDYPYLSPEPSRWSYLLTDLDGDGQQELILKEGQWVGVFTMKNGQAKQLVGGCDVTLCEGNILSVTHSYPDGNKTHCFYKISDGNAVLVDYLRYDTDADPENPWFRSPDLTGQDMTLKPVSEAEAMSVIASYTPLEIQMKPIADYPFGQ